MGVYSIKFSTVNYNLYTKQILKKRVGSKIKILRIKQKDIQDFRTYS